MVTRKHSVAQTRSSSLTALQHGFAGCTLAVSCLLLSTKHATAQIAHNERPNDPIEEMRVIEKRPIKVLRRQLEADQVAMFRLFNQLNTDDQFDVHCEKRARKTSHIKAFSCRPQYVDTAISDGEQENQQDDGLDDVTPGRQNRMHQKFLEKLTYHARQNPDLARLVIKANSTQKALQAAGEK